MASASARQVEPHGNRLFILALGLLVGFIIGFVILLSRLPVDSSLSEYGAEVGMAGSGFQFYSVLPGQTVPQREPQAREVPPPAVVIPPATREVPGNVQRLSARSLAAESYAEIPASSLGQESYYLQAGNYRRVEDAEKSRAALLLVGLNAFIVERRDGGGVASHRVRIGPFYDQSRITAAKERLKRNGINYKLIRVTG